MSFKRFLHKGFDYIDDKETLVKEIEKNCKEALKKFRKGEIIYRGMDANASYAGKANIRTDREPLSSSPFEHALFEGVLKSLKLPSRERSLFASTISSNVQDYGDTYVILPTDKWTFYYFPEIQDMTLNFPDSLTLFDDRNKEILMSKFQKIKKPQDLKELFLEFIEKDDNYQRALSQDINKTKEEMMPMVRKRIQEFIDTYNNPQTKGSVMDSGGNEIAIQGKSYYYFLDGYLGNYRKTLLDK